MFNGEPGPASAAASRNVVRSSSISGEICGSQQAGDGTGTSTAKKRRSSLGAKMVAIVGLTQWSKSTLQLPQAGATKKLRSNIRRSTETGVAVEMRSRVPRQGSRESTDGSTNSNSSDGTFIFPTTRLGAESQFSDFLDGLGPAQIVGRQTLATPPMGDVHIAITDRSGQLEVEVIEARGLTPKPGSKSLPATYIKVYLLENGACLAKKKTKVAKKTCDPLYQQALLFDEGPQGKVLQQQSASCDAGPGLPVYSPLRKVVIWKAGRLSTSDPGSNPSCATSYCVSLVHSAKSLVKSFHLRKFATTTEPALYSPRATATEPTCCNYRSLRA
ncbi:regulating synaptic membrane exocytosis protein 3 isoform X3 [Hippopotamus amphibius kiboko]|uniref:regulating synaptic membrane exocytosis protein 3 isoform X3 n=1 Tax=Hippopotamus amphibius kiboko TaxID=575201 RepID=UPI00259371A5|nr:regulating synaptic membrane exocytosis protein 3 isoform X3 [Hippopotamus amphibius kiboko]